MRVINFSEARGSLKGVIDQVIADADYTVIANAAHLARSIEQFRKGEVRQQGLVDVE